jgi:hypothetical protein
MLPEPSLSSCPHSALPCLDLCACGASETQNKSIRWTQMRARSCTATIVSSLLLCFGFRAVFSRWNSRTCARRHLLLLCRHPLQFLVTAAARQMGNMRACSVVMRRSVVVECALSVVWPVADGAGEEAGGCGARDQHDGRQRQEHSSQKGNWSVVDSHPRSKVIASRADPCPLSPRLSLLSFGRSDVPDVIQWQFVKHGHERVWR